MTSIASAAPLTVSIVPITSPQNWINVCDPSPSEYRITLTNPAGNVPVGSIKVDVTIPQGLGYVDGTTTINYPGGSSDQAPEKNGQQISWDLSSLVTSLEPGQQITIRFALKAGCSAIGAPASAVRADVSSSQGGSWAATSSTVRVNSGLLKVTKNPTVIEAEVGQEISWTITVTNLGTGPAYSTKLVDSAGSGLQPLGQTEWNWDVIATGASQQVNFPAKVISCENLFERATASWGCEVAPCQSNYAEGSIKIILKDPKFVFSPPSSISVPYCGNESVQIPYRNDGQGKAFNVHIHVGNLPAQYEITNVQGAVFQDSTLSLGDLDAGALGQITFDLGMKSSGGCGAPGAVIIFTPNYFDGCGNEWTPPLTLVNIGIDPSTTPSLSAIKTQVAPSGDSIKLGDEITYDLSATYSPGSCEGQGITANIVDSYPEGFEVTVNGGGTVDPVAHTITWSPIFLSQATPWSAIIKLKASFDPCLCGKTVTNRLDVTPNPAEDCCGCPLSASSSSSVFINCDSLFTSS